MDLEYLKQQKNKLFTNYDVFQNFEKDILSSMDCKCSLTTKNQIELLKFLKNNLNNNISECFIKDIHQILMDNIINGGIYRNEQVYISNTDYIPPSPEEAFYMMKCFCFDLQNMSNVDIIKKASFAYFNFILIHPFINGNGRTGRALLNYQLINSGYVPIIIKYSDRSKHIEVLEKCLYNNNTSCLENHIYNLELDSIESKIKQRGGLY